jgi:hypothetical protein
MLNGLPRGSEEVARLRSPYEGVWLLLLGFGGSALVGWLLGRQPVFRLSDLPHQAICATAKPGEANAIEGFRLYAAESAELAMFVLLCSMSAIALVVAVAAARVMAAESAGPPATARHALYAVNTLGLALALGHVVRVLIGDSVGFLTRLLDLLPSGGTCDQIRRSVMAARLVGETAGFVLGTAMTGLAVIHKADAETVARRIVWLQRLLYCASLLFVAGLLTSGANFAWVLANWTGSSEEKLAKAVQEVVTSGTIQAGIGYSALIAVFFLPIRAYLVSRVPMGAGKKTRKERTKALKEAGLEVSWVEDAKQILALLAPVLAAPIFDAIAKSK